MSDPSRHLPGLTQDGLPLRRYMYLGHRPKQEWSWAEGWGGFERPQNCVLITGYEYIWYISGHMWSKIIYWRGRTTTVTLSASRFRGIRKIAKSDCKLREVRPSVRMVHLGFRRTYFREISYISVFRKPVEIIQVSLKSDKNNWHFTQRNIYIYCTISLNT
jgi:hypothetical protein